MEDLSDNVMRCVIFGGVDGVVEILTKVHEGKATCSADALDTGRAYLRTNGRQVPGEAAPAPTIEDLSDNLMRCVIFGSPDGAIQILTMVNEGKATASADSLDTAKAFLRSNGHTVPGEQAAKPDPNNLPNIDENITRCVIFGAMEALQNCIKEVLNGVSTCSPEQLELAKTTLRNNGVDIPTSGDQDSSSGHASDAATLKQRQESAQRDLERAERDLKNHESSLKEATKKNNKSSIESARKAVEHDQKRIKDLKSRIASLNK
eukprot:Phypoly_transcript_16425.p1 GENE.Phypoly_transcript_16425~~Phypoly_transcript_16425.p1  ORF type:complete len:277 (+),score=47.10 Phypoly_transcript_16425:43-831(+)